MKNAKQTAAAAAEPASAALEQVKKAEATPTIAVAEQGAQVAPEKASSKKGATQKKNAPQAKQGSKKASSKAKAAKPASKKAAKAATKAREGSKSSIILGLIAKGATLGQLMAAAGWQAHSVRGFLSSTAKRLGVTIESTRSKDGERFYRLVK